MRGRLPLLFQAPDEPLRARPLRLNAETTPRQLVARVIASVPQYTVPAAALSVLHQVGEALVPVLMGLAIDRAIGTGDRGQLVLWLGLLAANFTTLSFAYRFGSRIGLIGVFTAEHRLRMLIVQRLLAAPPGEARMPGAAVTLAVSDAGRVAAAVALAVFPVGQLAAVLFGGAALLWLSWPIGLAVVLGVPATLWAADRLSRPLHRRTVHEQETAEAAAAGAADILAGYRVVRGLGAEDAAVDRYRAASGAALRGALRARSTESAFLAGTGVATGLLVVAIGVAAALAAASGALSVGSFIAVVGLTQFLLAPLESLAQRFGTTFSSATASAQRLLDLLRAAEPTAPTDGDGRGAEHDGVLEIEGLDVGDLGMLDLCVRPGELVAIDADGSQAASIARVLAGLEPPRDGRIRLGSRVLSDPSRRGDGAPLDGVLVCPYEAHLFSGSVLENVQLDGVTASRAHEALAAAGCEDLRTTLPDGYDSAVGQGGTRLSGGQRQRVALARALAQDAPVLVLHEPTTAVDAMTEARIAESLGAMRGRRTTIVITRSRALQAVGDRVVAPERPASRTA